jgi:hypothetical protein
MLSIGVYYLLKSTAFFHNNLLTHQHNNEGICIQREEKTRRYFLFAKIKASLTIIIVSCCNFIHASPPATVCIYSFTHLPISMNRDRMNK